MRFLVNVYDSQTGMATREEIAAISAFNDRLRATGQFVMAAGLASPTASRFFDGKNRVSHTHAGAHALSHDPSTYVSGFWILDVDTEDAAEVLASEAGVACGRLIELRPFLS